MTTPPTSIPGLRSAWREARTGPPELLAGALLLLAVTLGAWGGWLPGVVLVIAGGIALVAAIADPRFFLLAYVALIPFEGSTALGGVTNLSRFAGIAFAAGYVIRRRGAIRLDTIPIGGWLFLGVACTSYLWSIDRSASLPQLLTLVQLFVIAVLIADYIVVEERAARWVALAYSAAAVVTGCIGIYIWATARSSLIAGRATAFAGQDSAQFTSILIPALLVLVWEALRRPRILPIIGAAIAILAILASGTRSAWLALGIAIAAGILPRISWRQRVGVGLVLVIVALVAFFVPPLYTDTYGRLSDALSSGGSGRIDIWLIGLRLWTGHPLIGVGYGAFPSAMTLEAVRATALPTPDTGFLTPPIGSHSIIVGTLLELGVVGFVCVVAFLWSVARPHRNDVSLAEIARLAVLTMIVQALFLDVLGRKQLWLFIALAGGLTVVTAARRRAEAERAAAAAAGGLGGIVLGEPVAHTLRERRARRIEAGQVHEPPVPDAEILDGALVGAELVDGGPAPAKPRARRAGGERKAPRAPRTRTRVEPTPESTMTAEPNAEQPMLQLSAEPEASSAAQSAKPRARRAPRPRRTPPAAPSTDGPDTPDGA